MAELITPITDADHISGNPDAPVVIVEYGDYQCPYCGQAYSIVKEIQREFAENLCLVFRNFPLTQVHPLAGIAAQAAEAAGAQGKFWEMHDLLYEHQDALELEDLVSYAQELSLDVERYTSELQKGAYSDKISKDIRSAIRSGVNGTPTFFLNGIRYDDSWDVETISGVIRNFLAARQQSA